MFRNELDRSETTKSKCLYESEKIQVEMEKVSFFEKIFYYIQGVPRNMTVGRRLERRLCFLI